jgi:hypothetical protein
MTTKKIKIMGYVVKYTARVDTTDIIATEQFLNDYWFNNCAFRLFARGNMWYAINEADIYFNITSLM